MLGHPALRAIHGERAVQLQGGPSGDQGRVPAGTRRLAQQDLHAEASGAVLLAREGTRPRCRTQQGVEEDDPWPSPKS